MPKPNIEINVFEFFLLYEKLNKKKTGFESGFFWPELLKKKKKKRKKNIGKDKKER